MTLSTFTSKRFGFKVYPLLMGLAFIFSFSSFAQSEFQKSFNFSLESGPLLSNGTDWGNEIKDLVKYRAVDFQLAWRKNTKTIYNSLYRYPTFGIGYNSSILYEKEIGRPMAIYGFFEIPFSRPNQNKLNFGYFSQMGLGFNLKPFDPDLNPNNLYIGSYLNCYAYLGGYAKYAIHERVDIRASFGLKHFSNGSIKKPNSGINLFPLKVGVSIKLGEIKPIPYDRFEIPSKELKKYWNFSLYTGMKSYEINDPSYFRGGVGVNYLFEPAYKYRLGLGLDFFWAQGMDQRIPGNEYGFKDQTSLAVVGSWEWQLTEKLYVPIGLGVYLYRNELNQEFTGYYERIGARYRFDNNMFAGLQIKAHKAKADFFEFTVGYTIQSGEK
ncbi:lipid A 3-O-deacylase PagL [Algoriphagus boseongensis]|uniref:Lipid A 3-O-deacylase PagL n=2 Tax=Algoriphagus boseongensis TaxID=1442587 RepID=A0A4V3D2G6_9BACT|nr:lipid A 3-O-deacylase PagL [Algoriphagus boseongensis]